MSKNVYELVTDRIIEQLENGVIPWQKPWSGLSALNGGAFNRVSKKSYSLINQMILQHDGEYATFAQWVALGGKVKKGEKSEIVVFWKIQEIEEKNENVEIEKKQIPLLRYYNVFHISQVDGVEPLEKKYLKPIEPIEQAEQIKEEYKKRENIEIYEKVTNKAFYSPLGEYIEIPCKEQYTHIEEFYSTLFHEMIHSTMKKNRCDRENENKLVSFGSSEYSKEELVAEIGSANIINYLGIETQRSFQNSASYIASWLKVLKSDTKFIISASSKAEKATKYILNITD